MTDPVSECHDITVRVVREGPHALPQYETVHSAGMDLRAHLDEPLTLGPGQSALVPTGLRLEIPPGYEGQVRPRSGLALKRGITVLNTPGTIDADYRGDVGVILVNLSSTAQTLEPGDRIAQIVFAAVARARLVEADELGDTRRDSGGFGSTGSR